MSDFIEMLAPDIVKNDRKTIAPKEIDAYVPTKRCGFEYCGLYHHSDAAPEPKPKEYHLKKYKLAREKGVKLVQFFSDEWKFKKDICMSMIRHRLGLSERKIGARECKFREVSWPEAHKFFELTHISGSVHALKYFALFHNDEPVAMLSIRKPIQRKTYPTALEIARFSTALSTNVRGGLQRLMKHAAEYALSEGYDRLLTYADRRFGNGDGYERAGFSRIGETGVSYEYTDCILRYDRFRFRAKAGNSEQEIAKKSGMVRVYGCGSWIFEKVLR